MRNLTFRLKSVYKNGWYQLLNIFHCIRRDGLQGVAAEHGGADKIAAYVSVHAYSQLWMYPNGYLKTLSKHNSDLKRVAAKATSALR